MHLKKTFQITALFISYFMIPYALLAQSDFYKHMEGNISQGIHMKADLIRIEDRLTGYYYYYFVDTLEQMDFGIHYGKSLPVTGTFKENNSLEFKEFANDIEGSTFRGSMENGVIRGDWVSSDGSKTMPFELIETYPEGTIAFYVYHIGDKGPLLDDRQEPAATIEMTLLLPKPYASAAPVDSVNRIIYREFFGLDSAGAEPLSTLGESRDKFFTNYRKANQDLYQEGAASFNWEKQKAVRIQYNEKQILCMEFYDYGFTGGAHGLSLSKFVVVSLDDGHRIHLDEVFREEYRNDLIDILNTQVRKQYEIPENKDLRDNGFWVEFLEPSENFYVNKDGIGFYYNQYEVAPFAMGPVDVFVPYRKLQWIVDKEGVLYKVFEEK
jgi:hypothetical protein